MKKLLLLLCLLFIFTLCACATNNAQNTSENPAPAQSASRLVGEVKGNTYINNVIGFSATIPEGWSVPNFDQMSRMFGVSVNYLNNTTGLEPDSQAFIFFCSKYPYGTAGSNPGIGIQVSNQSSMMSLLSDEKALNEYIEQNRSSLEQQFGDKEAELSCETGVQKGSNKYSVIHISANFNGARLFQDMFLLGINDYAVMITKTYSDESDKPAADSFLESLKSL